MAIFGVVSVVGSGIRMSAVFSEEPAEAGGRFIRLWLAWLFVAPLALTTFWLARSSRNVGLQSDRPLALVLVDVLTLAISGRATAFGVTTPGAPGERNPVRALVRAAVEALFVIALLWTVVWPFSRQPVTLWLAVVGLASLATSFFWERARQESRTWSRGEERGSSEDHAGTSARAHRPKGRSWLQLAWAASVVLGVLVLGGFAWMFW